MCILRKEILILVTTTKPKTFTDLYFEDYLSLPKKVTLPKENIPYYLRHCKIDVTLEPVWCYLVTYGINAIVFGNDIVAVFTGTVANFTGLY